jgi:hypothetical protein
MVRLYCWQHAGPIQGTFEARSENMRKSWATWTGHWGNIETTIPLLGFQAMQPAAKANKHQSGGGRLHKRPSKGGGGGDSDGDSDGGGESTCRPDNSLARVLADAGMVLRDPPIMHMLLHEV